MQCLKCNHDNRDNAKFCEECATPLARLCKGCGFQLSPAAKFCPECAHPTGVPAATTPVATPQPQIPKHLADKILNSRTAIEGERKQVTVLFADLKGSMELIADRDPEEARKLLDPALELMMEAVHRYEGTVSLVMGDGIMAIFGAPLALEDHAVRACYAALRIQDSARAYAEGVRREQGVAIRLRVGLNSGEVLVRAIGSDFHMDYTAIGQTTHLAARMEQLADPGSVLMTPGTLALAEGYVSVRPLGAMAVKGIAAPVEVFELTGVTPARNRLQATSSRGLTRFVGRETEIDLLRSTLARAGEGRGQIVAIVGEPGVGKSRLVWEFTHSHRSAGWLLLEAASVSFGKATTYQPIIELLHSYFGIEKRDDDRRVREKVTGKILALDRTLEPMLPVFLSLLDATTDDPEWERLAPNQRKRRTQDALKRLLMRECQIQPVLLVFEDAHWVDTETQAVLDMLVDSLPTARLLLLINYRPEYRHGWSAKSYYQQVRLDTMTAETAGDLLDALIGKDPALAEFREKLVERTDGNPFFLEECVRALVETGELVGERGAYHLGGASDSVQLPASAQAILAARIDRLTSGDKRLLQAAAVIGKDVPFALLKAIVELPEDEFLQALQRLQTAEFLYEAQIFPEIEYTFKHALSLEVALGGLPKSRRMALHAKVVTAIERLYADRLGEHMERLANHAFQGEVWEAAAEYLRRAGFRAVSRSGLKEARAWFEKALTVLQLLPPGAAAHAYAYDIRFALRRVLTSVGEVRRALESAREAVSHAERTQAKRHHGLALANLAISEALYGELDEAIVSGTAALEIARRDGDVRLQIFSTTALEQTHYYRGDFQRVVDLARVNIRELPAEWVYEDFGNIAPSSIFDRVLSVLCLAETGGFAEAASLEAEMVRLAQSHPNPLVVSMPYRALGMLYATKGDWLRARMLIDQWNTTIKASRDILQLPAATAASAWVLAQIGEREEAQNRLRESEQHAAQLAASGTIGYLGSTYLMQGRAQFLLGRLAEARALADQAIASSKHFRGFNAHALHLHADVCSHPDAIDAAQAEDYYARTLNLAATHGMRPITAHCHFGLGKLYRQLGNSEQAASNLAEASKIYRGMEMSSWAAETDVAQRLLVKLM